jgi:hypothetical protein
MNGIQEVGGSSDRNRKLFAQHAALNQRRRDELLFEECSTQSSGHIATEHRPHSSIDVVDQQCAELFVC